MCGPHRGAPPPRQQGRGMTGTFFRSRFLSKRHSLLLNGWEGHTVKMNPREAPLRRIRHAQCCAAVASVSFQTLPSPRRDTPDPSHTLFPVPRDGPDVGMCCRRTHKVPGLLCRRDVPPRHTTAPLGGVIGCGLSLCSSQEGQPGRWGGCAHGVPASLHWGLG